MVHTNELRISPFFLIRRSLSSVYYASQTRSTGDRSRGNLSDLSDLLLDWICNESSQQGEAIGFNFLCILSSLYFVSS